MISLTQNQRQAIEHHGERTYPHECCGFLLGIVGGDTKTVREVLPINNSREDTARHNRFLITPENFMATEKLARAKTLEIVGVYHSHPDVEARPSAYDLEHAWPWYSYVIVSVKNGRADHMRAWTLADDRSQFSAEKITVAHESHESTRIREDS